MKVLKDIVEDLLDKHPNGGEQYFNDLDFYIGKEPLILNYIISKYFKNSIYTAVLTGKFGEYFINYCKNVNHKIKNIILFNGSLRKNYYPKIIYKSSNIEKYHHLVFIDDSIYSGKTFNKISNFLYEFYNQKFKDIFIVYDGSKKKNTRIESLYRYYDHH